MESSNMFQLVLMMFLVDLTDAQDTLPGEWFCLTYAGLHSTLYRKWSIILICSCCAAKIFCNYISRTENQLNTRMLYMWFNRILLCYFRVQFCCISDPMMLCCPGCWSRRENIHGFSGRAQQNIHSVSACQSACLSDTSCVAIDYDPRNPYRQYCWLLTSEVTGPAPGVTHYMFDRACAGIQPWDYKVK